MINSANGLDFAHTCKPSPRHATPRFPSFCAGNCRTGSVRTRHIPLLCHSSEREQGINRRGRYAAERDRDRGGKIMATEGLIQGASSNSVPIDSNQRSKHNNNRCARNSHRQAALHARARYHVYLHQCKRQTNEFFGGVWGSARPAYGKFLRVQRERDVPTDHSLVRDLETGTPGWSAGHHSQLDSTVVCIVPAVLCTPSADV